jgi:hypothetical protein
LEELHDGASRERSTSSKRGREADEERLGQKLRRLNAEEVWKAREQRLTHPAPPGSAMSQDLSHVRKGGFRSGEQEQGFIMVQRRRKTVAVQKGSSSVEAEGGQKAPLSVFLSGTSPATTEGDVKEKLKLCAALAKEEGTELDILKVEHIPLRNIPSGEPLRSRCWKVTVSADWAEHMLTSAAYPGAWGWRRWNRGPGSSREQEQQVDRAGLNTYDGRA